MNTVSIIVPTYNVEKYLAKCLNSLINQTYKDIIIYVVIDGSPDNSEKIAREFASKDVRVKCIVKENGGYGSVLEYAINMIDTDYFLVCDPDDWLTNDCVENLVQRAYNNNADMVIGNYYNSYSDGTNIEKKVYNDFAIEEGYYTNNFKEFAYIDVSPHSKLYRTSLLKNISFPKKVSYTDNLLFFVALSYANSVYYIDKSCSYYYFDRPGNSVSFAKESTVKVFDHKYIALTNTFDKINDKSFNFNTIAYVLFRKIYELRKIVKGLKNRNERIKCKKILIDELVMFRKYRKELVSGIVEDNIGKRLLKRIRVRLITNRLFLSITI